MLPPRWCHQRNSYRGLENVEPVFGDHLQGQRVVRSGRKRELRIEPFHEGLGSTKRGHARGQRIDLLQSWAERGQRQEVGGFNLSTSLRGRAAIGKREGSGKSRRGGTRHEKNDGDCAAEYSRQAHGLPPSSETP